MSPRFAFKLAVLLGAGAAACFDPLYEDGAPLTASWVVCCPNGAIDTCVCQDAASCATRVYPCPRGACSASPFCGGGGADGGAAAGGGAGTGGAAGGGTGGASGGGTGGGASTGGGGPEDAGSTSDAGLPSDAGTGGGGGATGGGGGATGGGGGATGGGGGATGGGGGATGGGGGATGGGSGTLTYDFCCVGGTISTCACPASGCAFSFVPCAQGRCVTSGRCG